MDISALNSQATINPARMSGSVRVVGATGSDSGNAEKNNQFIQFGQEKSEHQKTSFSENPDSSIHATERKTIVPELHITAPNMEELSAEEIKLVDDLKARDKEVRAHEQAHKNAGGQYAGAVRFTFQSGPDNKRYAIGGTTEIDVSEIPDNPAATAEKMQIVIRAAMAPLETSAKDRQVASEARQTLAQARAEAALDKNEKQKELMDTPNLDDAETAAEKTSNEAKNEMAKKSNPRQSENENIDAVNTGFKLNNPSNEEDTGSDFDPFNQTNQNNPSPRSNYFDMQYQKNTMEFRPKSSDINSRIFLQS